MRYSILTRKIVWFLFLSVPDILALYTPVQDKPYTCKITVLASNFSTLLQPLYNLNDT